MKAGYVEAGAFGFESDIGWICWGHSPAHLKAITESLELYL